MMKIKILQGGTLCVAAIIIVNFFGSLFYSYFSSVADVETEDVANVVLPHHLVANI